MKLTNLQLDEQKKFKHLIAEASLLVDFLVDSHENDDETVFRDIFEKTDSFLNILAKTKNIEPYLCNDFFRDMDMLVSISKDSLGIRVTSDRWKRLRTLVDFVVYNLRTLILRLNPPPKRNTQLFA